MFMSQTTWKPIYIAHQDALYVERTYFAVRLDDGMAEATAPRITGSTYLNQEVYNVLALCEFRPLFRWFRQMPILPKYDRGRHEHIYSVKTIQSRRMGSAKKM